MKKAMLRIQTLLVAVLGMVIFSACDSYVVETGKTRDNWDRVFCDNTGPNRVFEKCVTERKIGRGDCPSFQVKDYVTVCRERDTFASLRRETCDRVLTCVKDPFFGRSSTAANDTFSSEEEITFIEALKETEPANLAKDYALSVQGVVTVIDALTSALEDDFAPAAELGLDQDDLEELVRFNVIGVKESSYESVAKNIDSPVVLVKGLIARFVLIARRIENE